MIKIEFRMSGLLEFCTWSWCGGSTSSPGPSPQAEIPSYFPAQVSLQITRGSNMVFPIKKSQSGPWSGLSVVGWGILGTKATRTQFRWRGREGQQGFQFSPSSWAHKLLNLRGGALREEGQSDVFWSAGFRAGTFLPRWSEGLHPEVRKSRVTSHHVQTSPASHKKKSNHC